MSSDRDISVEGRAVGSSNPGPPASKGRDPDRVEALPSFRVTPVTFTNKRQAVTVTKDEPDATLALRGRQARHQP